MPPGSKKLTKQEKKLEKQRKKQEKKCAILFDHLNREVKYGNVTRRKHEKSWRETVKKIGLAKLREDLEYIWQIVEWTLDVKDCSISSLMDELDSANEQYLMTLRNHNKVIGDLLHNMHANLNILRQDFLTSLTDMKIYYTKKNLELQKNSEEAQCLLKTLMYRMEVDLETATRDRMTHYFYFKETLKSAENERETCEAIYGRKMTNLWNNSNKIIMKHTSRSEEFTSVLNKNQAALDLSNLIIRKNLNKIIYFTKVIKKMRTKLSFLYGTDGKHLSNLLENHEEFSTYLFILKDKLFKDNAVDTNRKKLLVFSCQKVLDHFRGICRKGELLIRLMSVNRKYETLSEKVLPYPIPFENYLEDKLFLFHQKIAVAETERVALMEEKKILQLERMLINKKFQDFCGCLECRNIFSKSTRMRKTRPYDISRRSNLNETQWWIHQKEDEMLQVKFLDLKKKMMDEERCEDSFDLV